MFQIRVLICVCLHIFRGIFCQNVFDDSLMYDISWAGPLSSQQQIDKGSLVLITTKDNEHYHCSLPIFREDLMDSYSPGPGPSPKELLKPLTTNVRCSYRLDTYWTYELCHGSHVRQYHDEKPVQSNVVQEYILGKADKKEKKDEKMAKTETEKSEEKVEEVETKQDTQVLPAKRNLNGREVPYYEVIMDNGTPCELVDGRPRQSRIIYMCKPDSHNEIISVKEVESCVYQLEVLTPLLCASEMYQVQQDVIHSIRCHSLNGSPRQPQSYVEHIEESEADRLGFREYQYMPVQGEGPADLSKSSEHRKIPPQPDQQLTQDFLNGVYCLRGGSGWWHYEYCHSRHVLQYHTDTQGKSIIYLGLWNTDLHRDWAKKNPNRKAVEYVTHYYGNGDICDVTGMARTVQVRLRCMKSTHLQEVSIYLLEPKPCHYILGVDSPILCPLIKNADEDGIFPTKL